MTCAPSRSSSATTKRPRKPDPPVTTTVRPLHAAVMGDDATRQGGMMEGVLVAYTLEQCWHRVPGGTGVAALRTAEAIEDVAGVELIGVAGRHRQPPPVEWRPTIAWRNLPIAPPLLYETWLYGNWPRPESVVPQADVVHATT